MHIINSLKKTKNKKKTSMVQPKHTNKRKEGNKSTGLEHKTHPMEEPDSLESGGDLEDWGRATGVASAAFHSPPRLEQRDGKEKQRQRRFRLSRSHHLDGTTEGKWTHRRGTSEEIIAQCFLELKNITIQKTVLITLICSNLHRSKETHHHFMRSCSWLCNFSDCAT